MTSSSASDKKRSAPNGSKQGGSKQGGSKHARSGSNKAGQAKVSPARSAAAKILQRVFDGQSLSKAKLDVFDRLTDDRERALANEIINGVLRWRWQLEFYVTLMMNKPLKKKDGIVQLILLMALYELTECRTPDYAIINEAVELVRKTGKKWAASLVNALLRRFTRERDKLQTKFADDSVHYSHPGWILDRIKRDWPEHWQAVLEANNQRPPFWLRINNMCYTAEQYVELLATEEISCEDSALVTTAIKLEQGVDVKQLPGFSAGAFSVQDVGAQLSAELLSVSEGQDVLDLCAAPGGKTCHILESSALLRKLVAVEIDGQRMARVRENLQRLGFGSEDNPVEIDLLVADANDYESWWDGQQFDRILIDAPCSASGVIRRHPDIKTLRMESDIPSLVELQSAILRSAWHMLKPGGEMLYVTCSVFKDENVMQVQDFIAAHDDAIEISIDADWGVACVYGRQLLPGEHDADGFYFCRVKKKTSR